MQSNLKKLPHENTLAYYKRLKDAQAADQIDLRKSEIYALLFPNQPDCHPDNQRRHLKGLDAALEADACGDFPQPTLVPRNQPVVQRPKATLEVHKDGSQTSEDTIEMTEADTRDPEALLRLHRFLPVEAWELTSAKSSIWQANAGEDGTKTLYSSRISAKPRQNGVNFEEIAAHFENLAQNYTPKQPEPRQYEHGAELLVPCLFDLHVGKLATTAETQGEFNLDIARSRILNSVQKYVDKLRGRTFEKIIFVVGNDYFNCEASMTTVAGTPQTNATNYTTMFQTGVEILIEAIDILAQVSKLEVVFVPGNHSSHSEWAASLILAAWYKDSAIITVDASPIARKYRIFGNNLLCFTHGDCEKDRIYSLPSVECPEGWAASTNGSRDVISGHLHHEKVIEKNGVTVRHIPSLCADDLWHKKQGYCTSKKRSMAFIYDKDNGLVETHYVNI